MKNLVEWIGGRINLEFYITTPAFELVIPFPFWKVVALFLIAIIYIEIHGPAR
ncbi:MAG: hypothetical protein V1899_02800 [Planctomycetota bacterium]